MTAAFIQGIGPLELAIVLGIVLLIFGPKRLPALARSAGQSMRELKSSFDTRGEDHADGGAKSAESATTTTKAIARPAADPAAVAPASEGTTAVPRHT